MNRAPAGGKPFAWLRANTEGSNMPDWQVASKGQLARCLSLAAVLCAVVTRTAEAQLSALGGRTAGAQVLVIGSYHMSNPGLDVVNIKADDVLAPKRQREIEELATKLAAFKPTKVAVEIPFGRDSASN